MQSKTFKINQTTILSILMIFLAAVPVIMAPSALAQAAPTTVKYPKGHAPTYVGPVSKSLNPKFFKGPYKAFPEAVSRATTPYKPKVGGPTHQLPIKLPPGKPTKSASSLQANQFIALASLTCAPASPGCDTPTKILLPGTKTQPLALNTIDGGEGNFPTIGDIEPPDGGVCAGAGYVIDALNIGVMRVYSGSTLAPVAADVTMDSLMGLTTLGWSSGGDISCLYDPDNGGHWFFTEFVSTTSEDIGGTFAGCFAAVPDTCLEGIAVSVSSNPLGAYNVYFLDPNFVNTDPGSCLAAVPFDTCTLLNDFAKIGNTHDAFLLFYDEFNLDGVPTCPAFGCNGFNGAQELAWNKKALELGYSASSPYTIYAYENMGTDPAIQPTSGFGLPVPVVDSLTLTGNCDDGYDCWYSQIPAWTADASQFFSGFGGIGFMAGTLDFFGVGDNRIATWFWQGLSCLNSYLGAACSIATFPLLFGGVLWGPAPFASTCSQAYPALCANAPIGNYLDYGGGCLAAVPGGASACGLAQQAAGPTPYGWSLACNTGDPTITPTCVPEYGIASNGDNVAQNSFAGSVMWFSISTLLQENFKSPALPETRIGVEYFAVQAGPFGFVFKTSGYFAANGQDIVFPSAAATDDGKTAVVTMTLTGDNYFPSSAYGTLTTGSTGTLQSGKKINIADLGQAPEDGFCEYVCGNRPRWGDYNGAIYVGAMGGVVFESEYIQSTCGLTNSAAWFNWYNDPSCGGIRDPPTNWGSSVNFVPVP